MANRLASVRFFEARFVDTRIISMHFQWPTSQCQKLAGLSEAETRRLATGVGAISTTRSGGVSPPPYDELNLGFHVGDRAANVGRNRRRLADHIAESHGESVRFAWLSQVHGTAVVDAAKVRDRDRPVEADASFSRRPLKACVVMTADCLPVLFCDRDARVVAAAHAGWRGLADGVLEATVEAMGVEPGQLIAWLGPAIGPEVFEVGDEVRAVFMEHDAGADVCFDISPFDDDRWVADLYELARRRLRDKGVERIAGGGACTYTEEQRFFSYRRDGDTGRMATAIWLRPHQPSH